MHRLACPRANRPRFAFLTGLQYECGQCVDCAQSSKRFAPTGKRSSSSYTLMPPAATTDPDLAGQSEEDCSKEGRVGVVLGLALLPQVSSTARSSTATHRVGHSSNLPSTPSWSSLSTYRGHQAHGWLTIFLPGHAGLCTLSRRSRNH